MKCNKETFDIKINNLMPDNDLIDKLQSAVDSGKSLVIERFIITYNHDKLGIESAELGQKIKQPEMTSYNLTLRVHLEADDHK